MTVPKKDVAHLILNSICGEETDCRHLLESISLLIRTLEIMQVRVMRMCDRRRQLEIGLNKLLQKEGGDADMGMRNDSGKKSSEE